MTHLPLNKGLGRMAGLIFCISVLIVTACARGNSKVLNSPVTHVPTVTPTPVPPDTFFDDFNYASQPQMQANGWVIRSRHGGPGLPDVTWAPNNVTLVNNPDQKNDKLLHLTALTDGTSSQTSESMVCHAQNYFTGTYAARVKFSDSSTPGAGSDHIVETFYTISPADIGDNYSELDNEYAPNGGWGGDNQTLYLVTWKNENDRLYGGGFNVLAGWHTIVMQAMNDVVNYYFDGTLLATHTNGFFPRSPMALNFSTWFINLTSPQAGVQRQYTEDVDWVYYAGGQTLSPDQVNAVVSQSRASHTPFMNTMAPWPADMTSPCPR